MPDRLFAIWLGGERREIYRREPGAAAWSFAGRSLEEERPGALDSHVPALGGL